MKKIALLPFFVLLCSQSYSQSAEEILSIACDTASYDILLDNWFDYSYREPPVYRKGFVYMMEDINWQLKIHNKFHGEVSVRAHVNCEGDDLYSHIRLERKFRKRKRRDSLYYSNFQEVLNEHTWGTWKPARKDGFPIDSGYKLLLTFKKGKVVDIKDYYTDTSLIDKSRGIEQSIPKYDSISVSIKEIVVNENSLSRDTKYIDTVRTKRVLHDNDGEKFISLVKEQNSYKSRPHQLLAHYNVEFTFYKNDTVKATLRISTITRNCFFRTDDVYIENYISIKFDNYISKLLENYGMNEFIDESEKHVIERLKKYGLYESIDEFIVK